MRLDELPSAVVSSPLPEGTKTPRTSMRLDEVVQTSGERVYQKDFDWASLQLSEGEKNALKAKGGIGYFEQSNRMKKMEKVPIAGMAVSAYESAALLRAVHRLQKNDYAKDPNLQVRDAQLVEGAMRYAAEEQIRGFTWGGAVIEGASQLPQYMIGFGLSKFLAKGATAAVTKNVSAKIAEQTANKIIQKAVVGTAVLGTEAAVGSATVFAPGIIAGTLKNEAQLNLIPTDRGYELNRQTQTAPFSSFAKSLGDTYIELFSEQ